MSLSDANNDLRRYAWETHTFDNKIHLEFNRVINPRRRIPTGIEEKSHFKAVSRLPTLITLRSCHA